MEGLATYLFRVPVQAGEIVEVEDRGCRLKVAKAEGGEPLEVALSHGMAQLKRPRVGDYLLEWPTGHIDVVDPVYFAAKVASGGADVT